LVLLSWQAYWLFASSPQPNADCGRSIAFEVIFRRRRTSIFRSLNRYVDLALRSVRVDGVVAWHSQLKRAAALWRRLRRGK
jgi:hypothetical protein